MSIEPAKISIKIAFGLTAIIILIILFFESDFFCNEYGELESEYTENSIKIMPLGNSITRGMGSTSHNNFGRAGFRKPLIDSLKSIGYLSGKNTIAFDFVGSLIHGYTGLIFDKDHEGHSSWHASNPADTTISILHHIGTFLSLNPPDIILLHLGTNDIPGEKSVQNLVSEVSNILDSIYTFNSDIYVILARIINRVGPKPLVDSTTAFNNALEIMADSRIRNGDRLHLVDMEKDARLHYRIDNSYPFTNGDMYDIIHPNNSGYKKIADVWFNKIKELLFLK